MKTNKTAPFCLWASFPDPHHPFDAPEPWSRLHDPDEVDLPPERKLDLERRPWWHRQSLEGKPQIVEHLRKIREEYSRIPVHTDQQLRELIANYYGMISLIDHNVGASCWSSSSSACWKTRWSSTRPTTATGSATTA